MRSLAVILAVLLLASSAAASVVEVLPLPVLAERSDVIVRAAVVDKRVEQEGDRWVTWTTLRVLHGEKGAKAGELLVVYQPGAMPEDSGGQSRWIQGMRRYVLGDEVVFFGVHHRHAGIASVIHLSLGVGTFRVHDGALEETVEGVVSATTGDAPVARRFPSWRAFAAALVSRKGGAR